MKEDLKRYIAQELLGGRENGNLSEDDDLLGAGLIDSIGVMSLVLFIEEEFAIEVPPEDVTIEHFLSISTIEEYLRQRLQSR